MCYPPCRRAALRGARACKPCALTGTHPFACAQGLGFSAYVPDLTAALESWKAEDKALGSRRAKAKGKDTGMSDEEALAAQQKLFAEARARCYAEAPPPPPPPPDAPPSGTS